MLRLSQLRFGGTPQIPVLTQPRRETLQHLRRFYLVAWLIWGLRCIVLIVDKADRLGWSAASPHKLALAKQAAYVLGTSCIGIALEIWGSYTLLHFWNTPRGASMVQWQQVLVYQYLALLTVTTYMLLESELAFVRLEGSQALFGVLVVIERLPLHIFLLDILPWTTGAQLIVWTWRSALGAMEGCFSSMLIFAMGGVVMPVTLLRLSED